MCGAQVRWKDTGTWHSDYNKLPGASQYKYKIEEINADNAQIMSQGFAYFSTSLLLLFLVFFSDLCIKIVKCHCGIDSFLLL